MYVNQFGDFGRSFRKMRKAIKKVAKVATAPHKIISKATKPLTKIGLAPVKATSKMMKKTNKVIGRVAPKPLARILTAPTKPLIKVGASSQSLATSAPAKALAMEQRIAQGLIKSSVSPTWKLGRKYKRGIPHRPLEMSEVIPERDEFDTTIEPTSIEQDMLNMQVDEPEEAFDVSNMSMVESMPTMTESDASESELDYQEDIPFPEVVESDNEQQIQQQDIRSMEAFRKDRGTQVGFLQKLFAAAFGL